MICDDDEKIVIKKREVTSFEYMHNVLEHAKFNLTHRQRLIANRSVTAPITDEEHTRFNELIAHLTTCQKFVEELRVLQASVKSQNRKFVLILLLMTFIIPFIISYVSWKLL